MKQQVRTDVEVLHWSYELELTPLPGGCWVMVAYLPGGLRLVLETETPSSYEAARRWATETVEQIHGQAYRNARWSTRRQFLLAIGGGLDQARV